MQYPTRQNYKVNDPLTLRQQLDQWLEVEFSYIDTQAISEQFFRYPEQRRLL